MFAASGVRDMERYNKNNELDKMAAVVILLMN
jgi:RNase H-fold protein (predicted Holliday junction resolvase)